MDNLWEFMFKKTWALMFKKIMGINVRNTPCNTIFASFSLPESANRIHKAIDGAFTCKF